MLNWWMWVVLGLVLLSCEVLTPGFYLFFLGFSAIVVGFIVLAAPDQPVWLPWLLFSLISAISLYFFRRPLLERFQRTRQVREVDTMIGETAVTMEEIPAGGIGKAELRGSSWNARNIGTQPVARSQRCIVEKVEGLTLFIRTQ